MNKTENFDSYCLRGESTDVGRVRKANEDSCRNGITPNGLVSLVCDGMGGHVGGATASRIAVETIFAVLENKYFDNPADAIIDSVNEANRAILDYAAAHPELNGMGSTCVIMIVRDGTVYIGHVGDSRIYLVRSRQIKQLTTDHSYVQMLVDKGMLTPEEAERHPRKNEITNALGIPNMQPATVKVDIIPEAGDCFVLCSDGLSGMVKDKEIAQIAGDHSIHIQERANKLVAKANEAGGVDNISVELVEFAASPAEKDSDSPAKISPKQYGFIAAAIVVVIAAVLFFLLSGKKDVQSPVVEPDPETTVEEVGGIVTEGETNEPGNDENKKILHLGAIIYDGTQPFLTVIKRGDRTYVSYRTEDSVRDTEIGDFEFSLDNVLNANSVIECKMSSSETGNKAEFAYAGRKAPDAKKEFSIILIYKDGSRESLLFTLKPQPAKKANSNGSTILPPVNKPANGGNDPKGPSQGGKTEVVPEAPAPVVPQPEPQPEPEPEPDTGNGTHVI